MDLHNRHAIVTGGSSGIGRALSCLLAQCGAHVSLIARRQPLLDESLSELETLRQYPAQRFQVCSTDLASWEQTEDAIHGLIAGDFPPELLINAAGFCHPGYVEQLEIDVFHDTIAVDFMGTLHATKAVLPAMMARKRGHIVNFSSVAGFYAIFGFSAYSAAKFAVRGFSEALRQEMRPYGINVSVVFPPTTDTPGLACENQTKPPETMRIEGQVKIQTADQVAQVVMRGIERRKRYILPGFDTKLYFLLAHLPPAFTGVFHWFFIDRIIEKVRREREQP
ncbi:MAG: SDR family oxidoreductase [Anaerolineae bacterium]|nr:SDR family oxidoreductase [Anaerolineae bacterium]